MFHGNKFRVNDDDLVGSAAQAGGFIDQQLRVFVVVGIRNFVGNLEIVFNRNSFCFIVVFQCPSQQDGRQEGPTQSRKSENVGGLLSVFCKQQGAGMDGQQDGRCEHERLQKAALEPAAHEPSWFKDRGNGLNLPVQVGTKRLLEADGFPPGHQQRYDANHEKRKGTGGQKLGELHHVQVDVVDVLHGQRVDEQDHNNSVPPLPNQEVSFGFKLVAFQTHHGFVDGLMLFQSFLNGLALSTDPLSSQVP